MDHLEMISNGKIILYLIGRESDMIRSTSTFSSANTIDIKR